MSRSRQASAGHAARQAAPENPGQAATALTAAAICEAFAAWPFDHARPLTSVARSSPGPLAPTVASTAAAAEAKNLGESGATLGLFETPMRRALFSWAGLKRLCKP